MDTHELAIRQLDGLVEEIQFLIKKYTKRHEEAKTSAEYFRDELLQLRKDTPNMHPTIASNTAKSIKVCIDRWSAKAWCYQEMLEDLKNSLKLKE